MHKHMHKQAVIFLELLFLKHHYNRFFSFKRFLLNSSAMDFKRKILDNFTIEKQQNYVEIFVLQDYSANLIHHNLSKLIGKKTVSKATVHRWVKLLKEGGKIWRNRSWR